MSYVAGIVAAVPEGAREAFVAHAREAWDAIFRPLGATRQVECWGDRVPGGEVTSFPMAVKAGAEEVVVFSWIEWPDRETYDAARAQMEGPGAELAEAMERMGEMPFDGKRMIFGGFTPIFDERG